MPEEVLSLPPQEQKPKIVEIMARKLAEILPPQMRGVYSELVDDEKNLPGAEGIE